MKKKWYDYLWIVSASYLILGFFNILFAWLGLLCFFIPLIISFRKGTKGYCNTYVEEDNCLEFSEDVLDYPEKKIFRNG